MQDQIFDLMYYGKMGWTYTELYHLPVHLRRYYYRKLAEVRKKEYDDEKAAVDKSKSQSRRR